MLGTIADIFRQKELRKKILVTIGLLAVFRMGNWLPVPFINFSAFNEWFQVQTKGAMGTVFGMVGMITAGGFSRATVFSLGIMPYISSSIIMQLLAKVVPALKAMSEEGGSGRRRINQYTRYLTVAICLVQSTIACIYLTNQSYSGHPLIIGSSARFIFMGLITITTGTMILMWLGEQISEFGIGNGISLIIMIGIISRIPPGLMYAYENFSWAPKSGSAEFGIGGLFLLVGLFLAIMFSVVFIYLGKRMIPVQYGRQVRGRREMGGQKQAIWLRVNQAGVIPVIFASALMTAPSIIAKAFGATAFGWDSFEYNIFFVALIIFFSYFSTSMVFNPDEIADNLKDNGSFVPGYRAGRKTADFFRETMIHLTFVGAVFLAIVAMLPKILGDVIKIQVLTYSSLFGGVGLLIVIGVSLDLMQKIQEHFYMRDYGGFLKKKLRGRRR